MKKHLYPISAIIIFTAVFALLPSYYQSSDSLQTASLKTQDVFFKLRRWSLGVPTDLGSVLIVGIDEESCENLEARWPWSRVVIGQLIDRLQSAGAGTIALNMSFTGLEGNDATSTEVLASAIKRHSNTLIGTTVSKDNRLVNPTPLVAEAVTRFGFLEKIVDGDFLIRRSYLLRPYQASTAIESSFPLQLVASASGASETANPRFDRESSEVTVGDPAFKFSIDPDGIYPINYIATESDFRSISAWKIIRGKFDPAEVRGRTVLVGLVSALFSDTHPTPMGVMSGVAIHANEFVALTSGRALRFVSLDYVFFLSWFLGIIVFSLFIFQRPWLGIAGAVTALFGSFIGVEILLGKDHVLEPLPLFLGPFFGLLAGVISSLTKLFFENKGLETKIVHDKMTGLYNYDFLRQRLEEEWKRSKKTKQPLTIVMTDLDRFKKINDTLGHEAGNDMIKRAAGVLKQSARGYDVVARYGGDEFFVLLGKAGHDEAKAYKARLRQSYLEMAQSLEDTLLKQSSISIGVATFDPKTNPKFPENPQKLLEEADRDLFTDKESRRQPAR